MFFDDQKKHKYQKIFIFLGAGPEILPPFNISAFLFYLFFLKK